MPSKTGLCKVIKIYMYLLDLAHAYLSRIIDCLSPLLVHHDKIVLNCLSIPQEMGQLQDSVFGCVGALC